MSYVTHLECARCGKHFNSEEVQQLCECGGPLVVQYDLESVKSNFHKEDLKDREPSLWRYWELLPLKNKKNLVSLGEGMTPMIKMEKAGPDIGLSNLYLKDEGIIPSGTFKSRGATVGVSRAKELGIKTLAMPTNGNAGASWSTYGARAGIKSVIVMPEDAPEITRNECAITGADLYLVDGLISDAGKIVARAVKNYGWFDVSTLKEPYRIEGKKTMGLEIAEQFNWEVPDVILYPTGGGVGIIGIYKALKELQAIGWIGEKMPRLVAVQATGCAPIVKAWQEKKTESEFWNDASTCAFGITVPKALGDFMVLDAIYKTDGCAIAISDDDLLQAQAELAAKEGAFICPEGASLYSAAKQLKKEGWLKEDEKVVLLNTGTGLKYPETVNVKIPVLQPDEDIPKA
ncbi:MAG: threonine synthase [Firmicutes bacterium]|nr:threonine synthase [Bacillota bacterium]